MSRTLIAVLFAAAASVASAASACEDPFCRAVGDDAYPPGRIMLPPYLQALVAARQGFGLSQAGFYNDPFLALELSRYNAYRQPRRGSRVLVERY